MGLLQHCKQQPVPQTTIVQVLVSDVSLVRTQDKYPEDYGLHERCVKFKRLIPGSIFLPHVIESLGMRLVLDQLLY